MIKIGSIVIRGYEFEKMMAFWMEVLHYVAKYPPRDGWVILCYPEGKDLTYRWTKYRRT